MKGLPNHIARAAAGGPGTLRAFGPGLVRLAVPAVMAAMLAAPSVFARNDEQCLADRCSRLLSATALDTGTFDQRFGPNVEMADAGGDPGDAGFSITVDGEPLFETETPATAGSADAGEKSVRVDAKDLLARRISAEQTSSVSAEAHQRKTDIGLERVDIQVKFDGLDVKPCSTSRPPTCAAPTAPGSACPLSRPATTPPGSHGPRC